MGIMGIKFDFFLKIVNLNPVRIKTTKIEEKIFYFTKQSFEMFERRIYI
jgi:hypothetical protein